MVGASGIFLIDPWTMIAYSGDLLSLLNYLNLWISTYRQTAL